ncbi:MAG: biotin transporter BioY [Clostridiales bacterium]|jgi:biotin transport system substrate-specific component|nr:biotin transporter BioY [Clostridiales bacterium]
MIKKHDISNSDLCRMAIFAAFIAICAQIAIPLGPVPQTLQTWAIMLAGIVLGAKRGTMAVVVYVLLGAAGAPVFALFGGGIGHIAGPSGGFILSFPIMATLVGLAAKKGRPPLLFLGAISALVINFLAGMLYFAAVTQNSLPTAFVAVVLPFLPNAAVQLVVLTTMGKRIRALGEMVRNQ